MNNDLDMNFEPVVPEPDFGWPDPPNTRKPDYQPLDYARKALEAGLSVVPCLLPSKAPAVGWLTYQSELPDSLTVSKWYTAHQDWGVGYICGNISGGVEVIDFDHRGWVESFEALIKSNNPSLLERLVIEDTLSGGRHYAYRCNEPDGNTKIAMTRDILPGHKPGSDGLTTGIETRGEGGYIVTYPTPGYKLIQGSWLDLPFLTIEERNTLWGCAAILDERSTEAAQPSQPTTTPELEQEKPEVKDAFHALLIRHGWTLEKTVKGREDWRRPGKEVGVSATWNYIEDRFYVFSSNAAPLLDRHCYSVKQVFQLLEPESVPQKDKPISERIHLTDMGNAQRFAFRFSEQFKYTGAWGWLYWNGKKWERDEGDKVMQATQYTVKLIHDEARDAVNPDDSKAAGKWALSSQSRNKLDAMIKLSQYEPTIAASQNLFDANPTTLNCQSGIIDLVTGDLYPHAPDALITKIAAAEYAPDAECPHWLSFIDRIMGGNQELIKFIQRAVGYSLTGSTDEQCFFLCYGTGANGKTIFLETISGLLNDYAATAEFSTFLAKQNETVRNDIAALAGARFVASSESGADKRLSESLIKSLTGGDTISTRFLFQEYFTFKPQFKVWMATNHKPVIRDTDHAIWRRVKLVPFSVTIPEPERIPHDQLIAELRNEYAGILAWAVRGCVEWMRDRLGTPDEVTKATESYRDDMDIMAQFIEDCCVVRPEITAQTTPIYGRYSKWCEANNEKAMTQREFSLRLAEKGFEKKHSRNGNYFDGIGLLADDMSKEV